jgi:hypothetical protein
VGGWAPTDDAAAFTSATSGRWKNGSLTVLSSRSAPHPPAHLPPARLPACLQIKLGTLDQAHAENEFVLRSYINSAKRSKLATVEDEEQQ